MCEYQRRETEWGGREQERDRETWWEDGGRDAVPGEILAALRKLNGKSQREHTNDRHKIHGSQVHVHIVHVRVATHTCTCVASTAYIYIYTYCTVYRTEG